jgi:hypothetical protein
MSARGLRKLSRGHWHVSCDRNDLLSGQFLKSGSTCRNAAMRLVFAMLFIVYFFGVGLDLAPGFWAGWNTRNTAVAVNVTRDLPKALIWPVTIYRSISSENG